MTSGNADKHGIDAVVTWVDGNDPRHLAKRQQHLPPALQGVEGAQPTRFNSRGEILYCLGSILKFAPFVRRIYVITDSQVPEGLERLRARFPTAAEKIEIIDHKTIFHGHEDLLPTFNSLAIETMLHRIPGLAQHYIYLNDDFFIIKPVDATDFFRDGKPVLRGRWRQAQEISVRRGIQRIKERFRRTPLELRSVSYKVTQWRGFLTAGMPDRYYWHDHTPHAFDRKQVEAAFSEKPHLMRENAAFRFRDPRQFCVKSFVDAKEIMLQNQQFEPTALVYMQPWRKRWQQAYIRRKLRVAQKPETLFACVQSLDQASDEAAAAVENWLERLIF